MGFLGKLKLIHRTITGLKAAADPLATPAHSCRCLVDILLLNSTQISLSVFLVRSRLEVDNPSELPKKASFTVSFLRAPSQSLCRLPSSPVSPHRLTLWTSGVQTVALISAGLIPSHFLKDFNYCLLRLRLISANACISLARAHAPKLAEGRTCAHTRACKAFFMLCTHSGNIEGFLNKPDRKLNGSDEQWLGGTERAEALADSDVSAQRVQGASHVKPLPAPFLL